MKKIKVVQIGIGHDHAMYNFSVIWERKDLFDTVGFVRPAEDGPNRGFMKKYGEAAPELTLEEAFAIPDLDAVVVETHDLYLVKYAQMAADRGLHVFMDKPGSQSCEDFEKILSTIKSKGKVFGIGYMYRYNPIVMKALKEAKEGRYGEIYSIEAHMSRDDTNAKRQWLEDFKGGMTFFLGCHLIDLVYSFLGIPEEIIPYNACTGIFGVTSEDFGMAVLKYKNGYSFIKTTACEPGGFLRRQLVVCGSLGTVEIKPLERHAPGGLLTTEHKEVVRETPEKFFPWAVEGEQFATDAFNRYEPMIVEFAEKINANTPSTDDELLREARVHRLVLAACGIDCDYKGEIKL